MKKSILIDVNTKSPIYLPECKSEDEKKWRKAGRDSARNLLKVFGKK